MLKIFTTLVRGAAAEAEQAVFDANALRILEQQCKRCPAPTFRPASGGGLMPTHERSI